MPDTRLSKQVMYSKLEDGKRTHGGQRNRYKDTLYSYRLVQAERGFSGKHCVKPKR